VTWRRAPVAEAIAEILAAIDPVISTFAVPPETLNPPAYVCGWARSVEYDTPTFGTDTAAFQVMAVAGPNEADKLDEMLALAKVALRDAIDLGGVVPYCHPTSQNNWRRINIAGADVLAGELTLEIRM
jgi:hypothetical protein